MKASIQQKSTSIPIYGIILIVFLHALLILPSLGFSDSVKLAWEVDKIAESYIGEVSKDANFFDVVEAFESNQPHYSINLNEGIYYIRIAGKLKDFIGEWSEIRVVNVHSDEKAFEGLNPYIAANYYYYLGIVYYYYQQNSIAKDYFEQALKTFPSFELPTLARPQKVQISNRYYQICAPKDYVLHRDVRRIFEGYTDRAQTHMIRKDSVQSYETYLSLLHLDPYNLNALKQLNHTYEFRFASDNKNKKSEILSNTPEIGGVR